VRRYGLAVLGGTFDHLHIGHQALLSTAFRIGDEVAVGLTTDSFLTARPKPGRTRMQRYATRRSALMRWLRTRYPRRRWRVVPLSNPFGRSVELGVGVLVVSRDTERGGRSVNRERRRLGRPAVPIVSVPLVLADDLEPVSSRRVRLGEIAPDGRRLRPLRVALSVSRPADRAPAARAVTRVFPRVRWVVGGNASLPTSGRRRKGSKGKTPSSSYDLSVRVVRRGATGWSAIEQTPRIRLQSRSIPGARPRDLERGLVRLFRPRQ
jgi:pantetheine-phosphate adenylyltransferase